MVARRLFLVLFAVGLFVTVLHAERARNDNLQDTEEEEEAVDFANENDAEDVIETIKRFLGKKKTTTAKPSSDSIAALITTTKSTPSVTSSTRSSIFGDTFGRKSSSTSRFGVTSSSTSRFGAGRTTTSSTKDACGTINPCKNGGSCKTLSSGRFYCFCPQDYYGKNCENKFMSTGAANNDRARKDHCSSSPCRNSGECVALRTTFYCRCKSPYYGISCDKRLSKREEIVDELVSSEQDVNVYAREVQEDNEDLRRAIANENMLENLE